MSKRKSDADRRREQNALVLERMSDSADDLAMYDREAKAYPIRAPLKKFGKYNPESGVWEPTLER